MQMINDFTIGFKSFFKAIPFIFRYHLWWTFLIPLFLNLILYFAGFSMIDFLGNWIDNKLDIWLSTLKTTRYLFDFVDFIEGAARFILQLIFFFVFAYFIGYLLLIILSPVFSWISEKTDHLLNGNNYAFSFSQFIKDIWRGILIALRNILFETGFTVIIVMATFIPVIGQIISPITFILYFIISSYFYGFSYMDYTCERKRLKVNESINLIRKYKGMAIANGMLFSLTLLIPFCGVMLAGFTAIIATVAATIAMNELPEIKNRTIQ